MEIFRWSFSLKIYSSVTFKLRTSGEKLCIFGKWFSLYIFFCGSDIRNERMTLNKKIRLINILVSLWYYLNNVHHVQCLTYLQWWMIYSNKPWNLFCKQSWRFSGNFYKYTIQIFRKITLCLRCSNNRIFYSIIVSFLVRTHS